MSDPNKMTQFSFKQGDVVHIKNFLSQGFLDGRNPGMTGDTLILRYNPGNKAHYGDYYIKWVIQHEVNRMKPSYTIRSLSSDLYLDGRGPNDGQRMCLTSSQNRNPAFEDFFEWELHVLPGLDRVALKSKSSSKWIDGRAPGYDKPLLADGNRWDPNREKGLQFIITKVDPPLAELDQDVIVAIRNVSSGSYLHGPTSLGLCNNRASKTDKSLHWKLTRVADRWQIRNVQQDYQIKGVKEHRTGDVLSMVKFEGSEYHPDACEFQIITFGDKFGILNKSSGLYLNGRHRGYTGGSPHLTNSDPELDSIVLWEFEFIPKQFGNSFAIPR